MPTNIVDDYLRCFEIDFQSRRTIGAYGRLCGTRVFKALGCSPSGFRNEESAINNLVARLWHARVCDSSLGWEGRPEWMEMDVERPLAHGEPDMDLNNSLIFSKAAHDVIAYLKE